MCLKEVFRDWREVCKVSFIVVFVFYVLKTLVYLISDFNFAYGMDLAFVNGFSTIIFLGVSLLTTTIILDKQLKKNNWGVLLGNVLIIIFYLLFEFILGLFAL